MFAALLLSAGALSDRVGARRAFAAGLALFVVASAACGLAPGLGALVVARFVQGAAAAVMMPSSMALIGQAYADPAKRARAVAMWAMGGAVASSSGPVLGGLLTLVTWRMIFFINLPAGAVGLILLTRTERSPHRTVPFDWAGQVTAVLAMGALTYGAIEAGSYAIDFDHAGAGQSARASQQVDAAVRHPALLAGVGIARHHEVAPRQRA